MPSLTPNMTPFMQVSREIDRVAPVRAFREIQEENASHDYAYMDQDSIKYNIESCQKAIDSLKLMRGKLEGSTQIQNTDPLAQVIPQLKVSDKVSLKNRIQQDIISLREIRDDSKQLNTNLNNSCCVIL